ncbi:MAG TPA: RNA polymerase sigma factor [Mycobacteriales bacterium]|jgi:RNA polymerase sigma-70 factor (ECF subfamily)|nr:RNA polymerase sigma factor [Mycobacteriales bacterium]
MSTAEFADLLRRAQQGDESAFNALFRDTQPVVLKYLAAIAGIGTAEDIASDTWVSVVRDLGRCTAADTATFRAWVLSIARRRWVDEVRRRARRPEVLLESAPDVTTAPQDVESSADEAAGTRWALGVLRLLPADQAEVIALRVIADLDVHTTAQIVGKTAGATRVLAHRGLRRLAELLADVTNPASGTTEG